MFDVICLGSATLDVFIKSDLSQDHPLERRACREKEFLCYDYGSKVNVDNIEFLTGGGATNTAVAFARLGLKPAFLGKVGKDDDAGEEDHSRSCSGKGWTPATRYTRARRPTGYSVILVSYEGDRTVLTFRGANNTLDETDIDWSLFDDTGWIYMSSFGGARRRSRRSSRRGRRRRASSSPSTPAPPSSRPG